MFLEKIIRPLVANISNALRSHLRLKQKISHWIFARFPELHYRLRQMVHQQAISKRQTSATTIQSNVSLSSRHWSKILSDVNLESLERPTEFCAWGVHNKVDPNTQGRLEPLLELNQMRQGSASVCFVIAINQADRSTLERTVQSVLRQTNPAWEILLCVPADRKDLAEEWLDIDWRIRRLNLPANGNEIEQMLQAAMQATSTFVGLLSPGDSVEDDLVRRIGDACRKNSQADVIYTDEIRQLDGRKLGKPFYKPDWSPEHQHSVNLLGRFTAVRKSLLLGLSNPLSTAQEAVEYEFGLSVTRRARQIEHIDDALYIRRDAHCGTVGGFFSSAALPEARSALERHLQSDEPAVRVTTRPEGSLNVRWPLPDDVPVTLLILSGMHARDVPGQGNVVLATHFVRSIIEKSTFDRYKIIVVDDGQVPDDLRALLQSNGHTTQTYKKTTPFSFVNKANFANSLVTSGIAILLNDDLEVISPDWIQALACQAARSEIGAVGAKLLFANGSLQHAGIAMGFHGSTGHIFHRAPDDGKEYAGFASIERNYSAVTGAVLAYRKEVFDQIGGFDEQFGTDYNDVDFCLNCIEHGYRVVYTPAAKLYHFHNSSFKRQQDKPAEREAFLKRWVHVVSRDPYFSKHFQTQSSDLPPLDA